MLVREDADDARIHQVRAILGLERVDFEEKYLGLPTLKGRLKRGTFQPLEQRFLKRMVAWKEKDLSAAGKEILIKAVAQSLPNYIMSFFRLTDGLCEDLMKAIRAYWWGSEKGRRKTQWIPWKTMVLPKALGGMGFKDLILFNQALLAKQAWRLITYPDSLCARVLRAKYFPRGKLLDTVVAGEASQTWRAIEYGLDLLKKGVVWRVGDGASIRLWRDNWLPRPFSMKPIGSTRSCRLRRVSHLIDQRLKTWDEAKVRKYFYQCDVEEILKIKLSPNIGTDWVSWYFEKSGLFSVRSAYRLAMREKYEVGVMASSATPEGERSVWKAIWHANVPSKVKVFAWKVVRNGLPTRLNKKHPHLEQESSCLLCGHPEEDCFHAIITCPHARALREELRKHLVLPDEIHLRNVGPEWLLAIMSRYDDFAAENFLMLIWRCWMVRNGVLQAGEGISISGSVLFLTRYVEALFQIRQRGDRADERGKQKIFPEKLQRWTVVSRGDLRCVPPDARAIKINVDGAFKKDSGSAAVGVIVRNKEGQPLRAFWSCIANCRDAEEAEALACLEGIVLGSCWPDHEVILESDCSQLIDKLQVRDSSLVAPIICDILKESSTLNSVRFSKVRREQNKVAHELAQFAMRSRDVRVSSEVFRIVFSIPCTLTSLNI
jgi:ribonuclease HI